MKIIYENHIWLCYQHNDQLPVGLVAQLVECCTGNCRGHWFKSCRSLNFFQALFSLLSSVHNCKVHFHIHFLNHSLHIWLSYIYSQIHIFFLFLAVVVDFFFTSIFNETHYISQFYCIVRHIKYKQDKFAVSGFSMALQLQLW